MDTALSDMRIAYLKRVVATTTDEATAATKAIADERARFAKAIEDYSVLVSEDGERTELKNAGCH
ncbi:hypothetical protein ACOJBO_00290 [Rhizobium beringeri]